MERLETKRGRIDLPAFLPDATRAAVRTLEASELAAVGVQALMVNVLHLSTQPGVDVIRRLGGLNRFMAWPYPIASDSGGFQIFSLITENKKYGSISNQGFLYRPGGGKEKRLFTPEKSIKSQVELGSDILFCLDQCTHPEASKEVQKESVDRTVRWAGQCKDEFNRRTNDHEQPPLLFAVIQGGNNMDLRKRCAESLLEIGFDGFGFGGWPIDNEGRLVDMVAEAAELVPSGYPLHALGVGSPKNILAAWDAGYTLFDSTLPTRDARRRRLYITTGPLDQSSLKDKNFYRYLYIEDKKYIRDSGPIDKNCSCPCCSKYSRGYLNHLFRAKEDLAPRLATLHNLTFYSKLMETLAGMGETGSKGSDKK